MVSLKQIFDWFRNGLEPDETQFKESWSSFWHKSEKLPQTQVLGLNDALNNKASKDELSSVVAGLRPLGSKETEAELRAIVAPNDNDSYYVNETKDENGNPYIWRFDKNIGENGDWVNTEQVVYKDVVQKADLELKADKDDLVQLEAEALKYAITYNSSLTKYIELDTSKNEWVIPEDFRLFIRGAVYNLLGNSVQISVPDDFSGIQFLVYDYEAKEFKLISNNDFDSKESYVVLVSYFNNSFTTQTFFKVDGRLYSPYSLNKPYDTSIFFKDVNPLSYNMITAVRGVVIETDKIQSPTMYTLQGVSKTSSNKIVVYDTSGVAYRSTGDWESIDETYYKKTVRGKNNDDITVIVDYDKAIDYSNSIYLGTDISLTCYIQKETPQDIHSVFSNISLVTDNNAKQAIKAVEEVKIYTPSGFNKTYTLQAIRNLNYTSNQRVVFYERDLNGENIFSCVFEKSDLSIKNNIGYARKSFLNGDTIEFVINWDYNTVGWGGTGNYNLYVNKNNYIVNNINCCLPDNIYYAQNVDLNLYYNQLTNCSFMDGLRIDGGGGINYNRMYHLNTSSSSNRYFYLNIHDEMSKPIFKKRIDINSSLNN